MNALVLWMLAASAAAAAEPFVRFAGRDIVEAVWATRDPEPGASEWGESPQLGRRVATAPATLHRAPAPRGLVKLDGSPLFLRVGSATNRVPVRIETEFHFAAPALVAAQPYGDNADASAQAEKFLTAAGVTAGYCLVIEGGDGRLAWELARQSQLIVVSVSTDAAAVQRGRETLDRAGVYGPRVALQAVPAGKLPFGDGIFDLIVPGTEVVPRWRPEIERVLKPGGTGWPGVGGEKITRAQPENSGAWTHAYGDPAQTANSGDRNLEPGRVELRWFGLPGARGMMDRQSRNPPPLVAGNRLYVQGDNRITGQDAGNGFIHWTLEWPGLRRVNLPRDSSNMCADEESLFVAAGEFCWRIAGRDGTPLRAYPARAGAAWHWLARAGGALFGSDGRPGATYTQYQGSWVFWYDALKAAEITKVCSERLFRLDPETGAQQWESPRGAVVNSTITLGGGRIYFVESRAPGAGKGSGATNFWSDAWLVALDAGTGQLRWEKKFELPERGDPTVLFTCYGGDRVVVTMANKRYHVFGVEAETGGAVWQQSHDIKRMHHGSHMYHPLLSGDRLVLEPFIYDLRYGTVLRNDLPLRPGCSTLSGAGDTLHYTGSSYAARTEMLNLSTGTKAAMFGVRASCWLSFISGQGMLFQPTANVGCTCRSPQQTSLAYGPLAPTPPAKPAPKP